MADIIFTPSSATNGVSRCVNLIQSHNFTGLECAAQPAKLIDGDYTPLLTLDEESQLVLVARDKEVGLLQGGVVTPLGTAAATVTCALADSSSTVTVMTTAGPEYVGHSGNSYEWLGAKPDFPPVIFETESRGTITALVPSYTFTRINLSGSVATMETADNEAYSRLLRDTYEDICFAATGSRLWVQPVMVRAYYLDGGGKVLHACAPVIAGLSEGWQGLGMHSIEMVRRSDTEAVASAWTLGLNTYSINLHVDYSSLPAVWRRRVARVAVCISPQIHPLGLGSAGEPLMSWRIDNPRTNNPVMVVTLPGATANFASLDSSRLLTVRNMVARMFTPAPSVDFYDSFRQGTHTLGPCRPVTPSEENKSLTAAARKALARQQPDAGMAELTAPHSFSATSGSNVGVWQLWGDITPRLSAPLGLTDISVSSATLSPNGESVAELTDSDGISRQLHVSSAMPSLLSPMSLYPHPGARYVTHSYTTASGARVSIRQEMHQVPGTIWSVALNPNLAALGASDFSTATRLPSPATDSNVMSRRGDTLAVTSRRSWTTPVSMTTCGHGHITTLTPGYRSGAGLDSGKMRACVFATSGIYVTAINAKGVLDSPLKIDMRPILSAAHVAYTPDGVYAAGSSELVRVRGYASVTMLRDFTPTAIGWHPALNQLWHSDANGNLHALSIPGFLDSSLSTSLQATRLIALGSRLWISTPTELALAPGSGDKAPNDMPIDWQARIYYKESELPRRLRIDMDAEYFTGDIHLSVDWGGIPTEVMCLTVDGPINAPIDQPMITPANPWGKLISHPFFTIRITGSATAMRLRGISLTR